ncbi:acyl-CoA dehydrogenase family protein [Lutimonas halocynthiae]|uniref:acyl-CoA dehydrogenase family protein n=1 Tax=Lutimonas halocynthiae TaxID=1446477 RepID=UPI0025B47876|nr:acyl-CoA dehydrogenase family protein [Lutimonas halocynthiae]MDN3644172.1 acyl-CoA dehydrogenase family protein [Lutimonas halocynthiae]
MEAIKGGEFLVREVKKEDVFITEQFSEEQKMMKDAVVEFIDREVWPIKERFEEKDYALTEELMRKAGEMGFLGVSIPEVYGGIGMGFVSTMLVTDYISAASGSLGTAFGAHTGIGTMPIFLYGTEEQKQKYLPVLTAGEKFGAYCLTEPGAGSDANSGKTSATLTDDGKNYLINGQKMWISNAGFAEIFIVFARIEDDKNITGFLLEYDKNNPNGVSFGEEEKKLGITSSSTRQVFFNDTKIPVENMLSERGKGFKIALNSLNVGRIKLAAACLDASRRILTESIKYANERIQFKKPISSFGAVQLKIAEMGTRTFITDAGSYRAAKDIQNYIDDLLASGKSHQDSELEAFSEYAIEAAILKVYGSETSQYVTDEGIQIFGGMGFSKDTPMEAAWRDARITRIYEGTNEINRLLTVGMLLKKAFKGDIDLLTPATAVGKSLMDIPSFDIPDYSELFSEEKEMIDKLKKAFLMIAGKAVQTFGMELEEHQQLILAAAEVLIEIYMAESGILKAEKVVSMKSADEAKGQIAMAKLNLSNAVGIINEKGKEAIVYFAEGDEQRMMLMGLKRFTKYTNIPNVITLRKEIAAILIAENKYCF